MDSSSTTDKVRNFYDILFILQLLSPIDDGSAQSAPPPVSSPWKKFLDHLAQLLDHDSVVPSIAVRKTEQGSPEYWVATNNLSHRSKCIIGLNQILQLLATLNQEEKTIWPEVKIIGKAAVKNCKAKIKEYRRRLCLNLKAILHDRTRHASAAEQRVLDKLDCKVARKDDEYNNCLNCFRMTRDSWAEDWKMIIDAHGVHSAWGQLKHHIGRLAAWIRSTLVVVNYYKQHGSVIANNFSVQGASGSAYVVSERPMARNSLANILALLESTFSITDLQKMLQNVYRGKHEDFMAYLNHHRENFQMNSLPHSEVVLLEHFIKENFQFWGGEEYIGSSKDSCFCCRRYFEVRWGNQITRACHGNVYAAWGLPLIENMPGGIDTRLLNDLYWCARERLYHKITSGQAWQTKLPDSSSGFGSVTLPRR